ncbi:unnamed protein product [marine sediment metagenome]|uniref:Uncharacterized protein n=1 Tax=marine sediment metagenome TaxID=412755 RepID=X1CGB0_9ZZZZ
MRRKYGDAKDITIANKITTPIKASSFSGILLVIVFPMLLNLLVKIDI